MTALMEQLAGVLEQETRLVHAGKVRAAAAVAATKAELAGRLFAAGERFKVSAKFLQQGGAGALRGAPAVAGKLPRHCCRRT